MDQAFPASNQNGYHSNLESLNLPDDGDEHVLALAIHTKSQYIITANLKDFPSSELSQHGVMAIHPDQFLVKMFKTFAILIYEGLRKQRERLDRPPYSANQFLKVIKNCGLIEFADCLDPKKL